MSEGGHDGAVQIQDQARTVSREMRHKLQQSIVDAAKLDRKRWGSAEQETPKSLWVGKARQARQELERAVRTQQRRGFDAIQAQDEGPGKSQHHLGQSVVGVPAMPVQMASQEVSDLQHSQKFVEEERTSVVRQTRMVKGQFDVSGGVAHVREILTFC